MTGYGHAKSTYDKNSNKSGKVKRVVVVNTEMLIQFEAEY